MPTIRVKLDRKSINDAIREIHEYRDDVIKKADLIRQRVAEELEEDVRNGFNGANGEFIIHEGYQVPSVDVSVSQTGETTLIIANGIEAVFIEFGAGVYYNPSGTPHVRPKGIVKIGEYGNGYGKRQVWGYYDEVGELKLTHGTPASMPMYNAIQRIVPKIVQIAKDVFGGG